MKETVGSNLRFILIYYSMQIMREEQSKGDVDILLEKTLPNSLLDSLRQFVAIYLRGGVPSSICLRDGHSPSTKLSPPSSEILLSWRWMTFSDFQSLRLSQLRPSLEI